MSDTYKSIVDQILQDEDATRRAAETAGANPPEPVEPAAPVEPSAEPAAPVAPVEPAAPVEPVDPANPVEPPAQKAWYENDDVAIVNDQITDSVTQTKQTPEFDDEDIKLILEYKKQGKTLKDFVNDYKVVDYNAMEDSKIIELALRDLEKFSAEDAEQAREEIEVMPLFQKKRLIQEYRAQFNQINEGKLKELTSSNTKVAEQENLMMNRFQTELDQTTTSLTETERYGIKITDEMSKGIKKYIAEEMSLQRKDGTFDVDLMVEFALWKKYGKDIVRANVTRAKNEGREEILKTTLNPSTGMTSSNQNPGFGSNGAVEDAFSQYLKNK